jgi:hypothetical protein
LVEMMSKRLGLRIRTNLGRNDVKRPGLRICTNLARNVEKTKSSSGTQALY